jgi:WhiB family redox-sensing transcriptional regulator
MTHETVRNWGNEDNAYVPRLPTWYSKAACDGLSGDIFFEEGVRRLVIEAKSYCRSCPVRIDCLEYAIEHEEIGIWGGMTTTERRRERRRRVRGQHGSSEQAKR